MRIKMRLVKIGMCCAMMVVCLLIIHPRLHAQSWQEVKQNKGGTLTIIYSENSPFIFNDGQGGKGGIEHELLLAFQTYIQEKHDLKLTLNWEYIEAFQAIYDSLRLSTRPVLGSSSISITEERRDEIKFCTPYMPDIEIIVTSKDIGTATNLKEFAKILNKATALSVPNSTFERNIAELKSDYFPGINSHHVSEVDVLIDSLSGSANVWGYIALPNYLAGLKTGKTLNRQRFFMVENMGLAIATTMNSDWDIPMNEFLNESETKEFINSLITKYLGSGFNNVVWSISDQNVDQLGGSATNKEVGVLTLENELQTLKLKQNALQLRNKNQIILFAVFALILISTVLVAVFRLMRVKNVANKQLTQQNTRIELQAQRLQRSYDNLKLLSTVGQEISARLTAEEINEIVFKKLSQLMDVGVFGIGIYDPDTQLLEFSGVMESGKQLGYYSYHIDDELRLASVCFREKKEIVIQDLNNEFGNYVPSIAETKRGRQAASIIYIPLVQSNKPIGVLTVQSFHEKAFSEYQIDTVRNIANYTKIALDNAAAYEQIFNQKEVLKNANEEIISSKEFIEKQNKELIELNTEKNDLLGIVAHDLKNPLTSAISVTDLFRSEEDLSTDQKEYLYLLAKCLNRMRTLINKLLDIKVVEAQKLNIHIAKVDLKPIVGQVISNLSVQSEKKLIQVSKDLISSTVQADPDMTLQVFENLISNAIKFSHPNSEVRIKMSETADHLIVEIQDEGPGLTEEDKKKLFGKFQRLSAKPTAGEESTGLGLSIVKKYVDAMNGSVWCESVHGKGAKFFVKFRKAA